METGTLMETCMIYCNSSSSLPPSPVRSGLQNCVAKLGYLSACTVNCKYKQTLTYQFKFYSVSHYTKQNMVKEVAILFT